MSEIQIRKAEPGDYTNVAQMHCPVWVESYNATLPESTIRNIAKIWAGVDYRKRVNNGLTIMLAEAGDEVVGMTIFGPDPRNPGDLYIDALYVKRECQRRGVGSALLAKALASEPSADVVLSCYENNGNARCFYEGKGFV